MAVYDYAQPVPHRLSQATTRGRRPEGTYASKLATAPAQNGNLHVQDLRTALIKLPVEQREAVLLVAAGVSYEEAAQICGTAIGTIKSRVNRARNRLSELLGVMNPEDIGADHI